jgi:hypothetical protein
MSSLIDNLAKHLPKPPVAPAKPKPYYGVPFDRELEFTGIALRARRERIALPRRSIPSIDFTSAAERKFIKHTILNVWSGSHPLDKPNIKDVPVGTVWHDEWEGLLMVRTESGWLKLQ